MLFFWILIFFFVGCCCCEQVKCKNPQHHQTCYRYLDDGGCSDSSWLPLLVGPIGDWHVSDTSQSKVFHAGSTLYEGAYPKKSVSMSRAICSAFSPIDKRGISLSFPNPHMCSPFRRSSRSPSPSANKPCTSRSYPVARTTVSISTDTVAESQLLLPLPSSFCSGGFRGAIPSSKTNRPSSPTILTGP